MAKRGRKIPAYSLHKASGQAVVRIHGRDHYLGVFGSPESHSRYSALVAESLARQPAAATGVRSTAPPANSAPLGMTVSQVLLKYQEFAREYYSHDGEPTKEFVEMGLALKPVRVLYSDLLAAEFGPLKLQAVRQQMIDQGLSRGVVNNRINRVKRFFKWAVSQELPPPAIYEGLRTVGGLKRGRTAARETEPVRPVEDAHVERVLPLVSPQVAAMIQLQRLTGMRPCEVVVMRPADLDRRGDVWVYELAEHKNAWRGHRRLVPLGPRAQEVLEPFLCDRPDTQYLFSPKEAEEHRRAVQRCLRRTKVTPSQAKRKPKRYPKHAKRERYDVDSYRRAIHYGIRKANRLLLAEGKPEIPRWFPLQLRHSRATELNENFGIEAAAVTLGHAHAETTRVYAERNLKLALEVARQTG